MRPELPILTLGLAWLLLVPAFAAESPSPGDACSTAGLQIHTGGPEDPDGNFLVCNGTVWKDFLDYKTTGYVGILQANPQAPLDVNGEARIGNTSLTCSGTTEGAQRYNSTDHVMEFCNGTTWTPFAQVQTTSGPTAPAGSGYFVLTHTTWNGNLGGISGADAKCLTELGTTYTSWRGYSTANSNGQITAGKVHAFLCVREGCNNLMPLTTYYFAYANDGTPGGASFTTDATGLGPNDSAIWSAANYFSGTYTYWMNRQDDPGGGVTPTKWTNDSSGTSDECARWTDSSSGSLGDYGNSSMTDARRWWESRNFCDNTKRLICFVNP